MIKNDTTYSGFTNKQTWNINLTYSEIFANMAEGQEYDDVEHMADSFESLVNELEFEGLRSCSLAHLAVGEYLETDKLFEPLDPVKAEIDSLHKVLDEVHKRINELEEKLN